MKRMAGRKAAEAAAESKVAMGRSPDGDLPMKMELVVVWGEMVRMLEAEAVVKASLVGMKWGVRGC
jgi:hypothetical protein